MKLKLPTVLLMTAGLVSAALLSPQTVRAADMNEIKVKLVTDKGDIHLDLYPSKAPVTVASFLNLAKKDFYDGLTFHRVIKNFMIQGGDPAGTGSGGPGYKFEDEVDNDLKFDKPGLLAMANAGPRTNGSQFFITHVPTPHLTGKHTIFGHVTEGQAVVDAIQAGDKIKDVEVIGSTDALFEAHSDRIAEWNKALKK